MSLPIETARLRLSLFRMEDADDVFGCITPAVTRFMRWDPPASRAEFLANCKARLKDEWKTEIKLVVRKRSDAECIGITAINGIDETNPELGLWLREAAQGQGYGREIVEGVARWATANLHKEAFIYPVAVENVASRRIAESLNGEVTDTRTNPKYESVVYTIPALG